MKMYEKTCGVNLFWYGSPSANNNYINVSIYAVGKSRNVVSENMLMQRERWNRFLEAL